MGMRGSDLEFNYTLNKMMLIIKENGRIDKVTDDWIDTEIANHVSKARVK